MQPGMRTTHKKDSVEKGLGKPQQRGALQSIADAAVGGRERKVAAGRATLKVFFQPRQSGNVQTLELGRS